MGESLGSPKPSECPQGLVEKSGCEIPGVGIHSRQRCTAGGLPSKYWKTLRQLIYAMED